MTVKELKKALRGIPDSYEVAVLVDGWESQLKYAWSASYDVDEEEGDKEIFTINC